MISFLAIYHGHSPRDAELVAVSVDTDVVRDAAAAIRGRQTKHTGDRVLAALAEGRDGALARLVLEQGEGDAT